MSTSTSMIKFNDPHIDSIIDHVLCHNDPDQAAAEVLGEIAGRLNLDILVWPHGDHIERLHVASQGAAAAIRALADQHHVGVDGAVLDALRTVVRAAQERVVKENAVLHCDPGRLILPS